MLICSVAMCTLCCPRIKKYQHAHLTALPCVLVASSMPNITKTINFALPKKQDTAAPDSSLLERKDFLELGQNMLTWHCSIHLLRVIVHRLVSWTPCCSVMPEGLGGRVRRRLRQGPGHVALPVRARLPPAAARSDVGRTLRLVMITLCRPPRCLQDTTHSGRTFLCFLMGCP